MPAQVTYRSPLHHVGTVQTRVKPLPSVETLDSLERSFVNDGVRTEVWSRPRGIPIIPGYDARRDPGAQGYMQGRGVREVVRYTMEGEEKPVKRNQNKLSSRGRCIPTPDEGLLGAREKGYTNDAVRAERQRTKYRDTVLPPYNALTDAACRDYFQRNNVVLVRTSSVVSSRDHASDSNMSRDSSKNSNSTIKSNRGSTETKPRQVTPEQPRDNMPATRSQSKSPRKSQQKSPGTENKNSNNNGSNKNNPPPPRKTPTTPRIPSAPLAEPVRTNKLSTRGRCIPTPPPDVIREREQQFVLDSITISKRRTRFNEIIPEYNAVRDVHAKAYINRDDVRNLMSVTCTLKPWEKDVKENTKK